MKHHVSRRGLLESRPRQDRHLRNLCRLPLQGLSQGRAGWGGETPLWVGGAPEQAGPLSAGGREGCLRPLCSPPAHRCFSSSEWARVASRVRAWWRGPRGLSGCFPEHPQPLKVQRNCDQLAPRARPQHCLQLSPILTPQGRGSPGRPSVPTWGVSRRAEGKTLPSQLPNTPPSLQGRLRRPQSAWPSPHLTAKPWAIQGLQGLPHGASPKQAQARAEPGREVQDQSSQDQRG